MFLSLTALVVPALTGLLLRKYRPVLANRIGHFLSPIGMGFIVFILTFGVYINMYIFYIIDFKAIIACCLLPWLGFVGGAVLSFIGTRDTKKTIAICIETGIQNTAVAIFFLRLTFPQPESDIALANPILVLMATPVPFIMLILMKTILEKCTCCRKCLPKKMKLKQKQNVESPEKFIEKQLLEEAKPKETEVR